MAIRRGIWACTLLIVLVNGAPHFAISEPARSFEDVEKEIADKTRDLIKSIPAAESFVKKQTQAVIAGEDPPYKNGVPLTQLIENHTKLLFGQKIVTDFYVPLVASAIPGVSGGSCVGTPPIPKNFCQRCIAKIPFGGPCIAYKIMPSVNYRYLTQWTEQSPRSFQSAFTSDQLIKLTKTFRYGEMAQIGNLAGVNLGSIKPKELVKALPHDLLREIEMKHVAAQTLLALAQRGVLSESQRSPAALAKLLMDFVKKAGVDREVLNTIKDVPDEKKPGITQVSSLGMRQYAFTEVPAYTTRMLDHSVFRKVPVFQKIRQIPYFEVGVKSGTGIMQKPLTMHNIKAPFAPGIDVKGLTSLAAIVSGKGKSADSVMGGAGLAKPVDHQGTFTDALDGKFGDFGGKLFGQIPKNGLLGNLGSLGRVLTMPRSPNFNPVLDNYNSQVAIPKLGLLVGSFPVSAFSFMPLLDNRLIDSVSPMMKILKFPDQCDKLWDKAPKLPALDDKSQAVKALFTALKKANPLLGKELDAAYNSANGDFKKIANKLGVSWKPACMGFNLGQGGKPTTWTKSSNNASSLVKAVGFDGNFVERATSVLDPVTGRVGSPTFYRKLFKYAGEAMPPKTDKFLDVVGYGHTKRFEENPRTSGTKIPSSCTNPEMPKELFGDLQKAFAPLDPPDVTSQWTGFRICPEGSPLNDDVANGNPLLSMVWNILKAVGAENLWRERRE